MTISRRLLIVLVAPLLVLCLMAWAVRLQFGSLGAGVWLAIAIGVVLWSVLGALSYRAIVMPLHRLKASVKAIADGDYAQDVPFVEAGDEVGAMARSIDVLKHGAADMAEQRWVKSQAAQLSAVLQRAASLEDFGRQLLTNLVPLLGGGVAALYLHDAAAQRVRRIARYGLSDHSNDAEWIDAREGLIGECVNTAAPVRLAEIPAGYCQITSGLGQSSPTHVIAWPLVAHEIVVGAVEFASFHRLGTREGALVSEALPAITMNLEILERNLRTQELLTQTQQQAAQLEAQTAGLEQSQAELLTQQEALITQQATLLASEEQFRTLLEAVPDALIICEEHGRIAIVNAKTEQIFGYPRQELVGQPITRIVPERVALRRQVLGQGPTVGVSGVIRTAVRQDGTEFPVEIGLNPLPQLLGRARQVCYSLRDITVRQKRQQELAEARDAAEEATRAKSDFLATMSHEIRTPMNAIINMTQLTLETELTRKQHQYLNVVGTSARGLLALINDILDFSKIEAGKIELEATPFDLRTLFDGITDSFRGRVMEKRLEFVSQIDLDVPHRLVGDPLRLQQVLINLVGNAFKFTDTGEVVLRVSRVDAGTDADPRQDDSVGLRFSVRDTGIGIPKEAQRKLFAAFTQVDTSTSRRFGGTGLGLAISRRLVGLMGGDLALDSEVGRGTEFFFAIRLPAQPEAAAADLVFPAGIRDRRVLVIEDNRSNQQWIANMLQSLGFSYTIAGTAEEGLDILQHSRPDAPDAYGVALVDWQLPGMDGIEAGRRIHAAAATRDLPLVMVSAFASADEEAQARAAGFQSVLPKPLSYSTMYDSIVEACGHTDRSPAARRHHMPDDHSGDGLAGVRVLVAEDNASNRLVAQELLEHAGMIPAFAENGRIALTRALAEPFDVILMDMQMPEMDGIDATREIRRAMPGSPVPIIALTANVLRAEVDRCLSAGMNDFVSKPIDRAQLFSAIRKWLPRPAATAAPPDTAPPPAVPAADTVPDLPGFHFQGPMERLGFPWPLFSKMLQSFSQDLPENRVRLGTALAARDWPTAIRAAHSIKGSASSYGAEELAARAGALEASLKHQSGDYDALFEQVGVEAQVVMDSLQRLAS